MCVPNCNVVVNCPLFLQCGPHGNFVEILHTHSCGFTGFQDTRTFRLEIISLATGLSILALLACLARHGGSHWCF